MGILGRIFKDPNEKEIKKIEPTIAEVNAKEKTVQKLSDAKIQKRYQEISREVKEQINKQSQRIKDKESKRKVILDILNPYIPEVFALTREAARRTISQRHYDVQLIGGYALNQGKIAEMKTGEGKTLVATLTGALNALTGLGVHIVTVNDYLAKRDCGWMGQVYDFLGLKTATIVHDAAFLYDKEYNREESLDERTEPLRPISRKEAYEADITYGTNNEFGFDYLRDNMAQSADQMVQRELHFAIVDEVDSILIDEARTPLIISAPAEEATDKYYQFAEMVKNLKKDKDFVIDEKSKSSSLTDEGIEKIERILGVENIYEDFGIENVHHIEQALKAHALFKKDKDYVVKDNEIVIVDEFTGRLMQGRRYSEGLHQAIEAKEGVEIKRESITMATISFQNYFRLYTKLSGMTGTAITEAEEFHKIYNLDVVVIPTNNPLVRKDFSDVIYKNEKSKFLAVVEEIKQKNQKGQPVLVGTVSIEKNEILSDLLKRGGIKHELLNAKNHEKEALIIEKAGQKGAVTVATNMAGRGTDIILSDEVKKLGGLHVIGTERHESRRIDNQLRGRSGRQGDPGSTQFYVSLDDDLMRIFGSERIGGMMETLKLPEDTPIQHPLISKSLEQAQKRVEAQNFDIRKHLVEYDDVMNKQREYIYTKRRMIMNNEDLSEEILGFYREEAENLVNSNFSEKTEEIDNEKILAILGGILELDKKIEEEIKKNHRKEDLVKIIYEYFKNKYKEKTKSLGTELSKVLEKAIYLRTIDMLWINHIDALTHLREGIGLRGYGQKDPLVEYKNEAYRMFQTLLGAIQSDIVNSYFKVTIQRSATDNQGLKTSVETPSSVPETKTNLRTNASSLRVSSDAKNQNSKIEVRNSNKVGRNDPCPCGSGKKYKKCHGR
ncbi:MAG: preprotein translocase subunit SecA [Patescibacteria group bacterium]|nr:preprotein translocase subunit SecA [Patescibacteria group bacterium]